MLRSLPFDASPRRSSPRPSSLLDRVAGTPELARFLELLERAEVATDLDGPGAWTVLAPTNAAFERLGARVLDALLAPSGQEALVDLAEHHVARGVFPPRPLGAPVIMSVLGVPLALEARRGRASVGGVARIVARARSANGELFVVDRVLLPPAGAAADLVARARRHRAA